MPNARNRRKKKQQQQELEALASKQPESPLLKFTYGSMVKTGVKTEANGSKLFDVKFNHLLKPGEPLIFATAGPSQVRVYECLEEGEMKLVQVFEDAEECFYVCAWSTDSKNQPLLAAAGKKGSIRVFEMASGKVRHDIVGHTHDVNDLRFHPKHWNLLFSASKDHSIRLWNIEKDVLVAVFYGDEGHRDEVITLDINPAGTRLCSGGMDHAIKVWKLDGSRVKEAIKSCFSYDFLKTKRPFPTFRQHYPDYSTRSIHGNYVDCVRWFGDFIISKACSPEEGVDNQIEIWKAGKVWQEWEGRRAISLKDTDSRILASLPVKDCKCWYMRFALDAKNRVLAIGKENGRTVVFDLTTTDPSEIEGYDLVHVKCTNTAIRQTAFSRDGSVLICVCDDGSIWRWNNRMNRDGDDAPKDGSADGNIT